MRFFQVWYALPVCTLCLALSLSTAEARGADDLPPAPNYVLAVWAAEDGLPLGSVFAIAQGLDGYLWLGTGAGLVRFDGTQFTRWTPAAAADALPTGPVHALAATPDGSLWVGFGGGGGIVRIDGDRLTRYSPREGAPGSATAMLQDREGSIWIASSRGLFRYAGRQWTKMAAADGYEGVEAFSLFEDRAGHLWVGTAAGVYRRDKDRFSLIDATATSVQDFAEDAAGSIWVTDPVAIVRRLGSGDTPRPGPSVRLPTGGWRVIRDRRGQVWVATFGGGLLRMRHAPAGVPVVQRFAYEERLAGSPRSLFEDREGNLWVGMRGGLLRLTESAFANAEPLEGLNNDGVRTAAVDRDGNVWVATGHALNRFSGTAHQSFALSQTMAMHADRHGTLWVSTSQELGRFEDGRLVPMAFPGAERPSRVMALTSDARDTLWLCSALKGVLAWDGTSMSRFDGQRGVANRSCQSMFTDRHDRVWMGFLAGGAAVYDHGTFQVFGERDGLTGGTVHAILEDRNGGIWFSTARGVSRYRNGRFASITASHAPLVDIVPVLVEDQEGYLWVGVNAGAGVIRFHPDDVDKVAADASHQVEYAFYDESDWMQRGSQTWQSGIVGVRGADGRLWVATGLGMTIIDPRNLPPERRPSPPRIETVSIDGRRVEGLRDLQLPSATSTVRIEYGAVSLTSASKLRFRYMLDGVDEDWVYASAAREATYTNLPSGPHRFRVSATNDGQWTEAAFWEFTVAPPFYMTRAFVAVAAAAIVLTLVMAWWMRMRAVRQQYALVFAERARVSREIHDTLLQSLAAIGVELETIATQLDSSQNPARAGLRRLRRQVGHCLREARESIMVLRNTALRPRALVDSLQDLAHSTAATRNVRTAFVTTGRPWPCSEELDLQLFRIGQEAVTNAIRHGQPQEVRITLAFEPDRIVLTVVDDGRGFVPEEHDPANDAGEHLGLLSMRERAARVRGQVAITSSPGRGTTVETTVPKTE